MGILSKLFGSDQKQEEQSQIGTVEAPPCPHSALTARWDSIEDIGHEERATAYICEACGQTFTPQEAEELRRSEVERLPIDI
jgi:hypothetical protein